MRVKIEKTGNKNQLIERWNWKQTKLQQKGKGKKMKILKFKNQNEKQNIWKTIIEVLHWKKIYQKKRKKIRN
jgi:hypothetical protein